MSRDSFNATRGAATTTELDNALDALRTACVSIGHSRSGEETRAHLRKANEAEAMVRACLIPSAVQAIYHPQGHDDAKRRIGELVREVEMICDAFGYDPYEWLVNNDDDVTTPQSSIEEISFIHLGGVYETNAGERVKMVNIANVGTHYETLIDEAGVNRYSRRSYDMGRVTGSPQDHPGNIKRPIRALALHDLRFVASATLRGFRVCDACGNKQAAHDGVACERCGDGHKWSAPIR